jgi:hypothetical protein
VGYYPNTAHIQFFASTIPNGELPPFDRDGHLAAVIERPVNCAAIQQHSRAERGAVATPVALTVRPFAVPLSCKPHVGFSSCSTIDRPDTSETARGTA